VASASRFHEPVLLREVLDFLNPVPGGCYLDGTLGGGGHAKAILEASSPGGHLWGVDLDQDAINYCKGFLGEFGERVHLVRDNFSSLKEQLNGATFDGALLDLGISSFQIDKVEKGFSYRQKSPLDMRYDRRSSVKASTVLNTFTEEMLTEIFSQLGEERHSRRIARAVVRARIDKPIEDSYRLTEVITSVIPRDYNQKSVARIFQALRIYINDELESLELGLESIFKMLDVGGRLVVISYHSLEDRLVKRYFRFLQKDCICPRDFPECRCDKEQMAEVLTRRPIRPSSEETKKNARARSSRLRAIRKVRL
jgi:16S rRNA (cytosine1402-N4)-methyltransferase